MRIRGDYRTEPRLWHHDYLHLRPLACDFRDRIRAAGIPWERVLDIGSGDSPYRACFGDRVGQYVRADLDPAPRPDVLCVGEALPFRAGSFDGVLASQVLPVVEDPFAVCAEIARVTRPGGRVFVSCHGTWPHSTPRPEHRFGEPDLPRLFEGLRIVEIVPQGGMLALPFALFNVFVRETARVAERRIGAAALPFWAAARVLFVISNGAGRALERLSAWGPFRSFLGYLDRSLPLNYLVVAEKTRTP